MHDPLDLVLDAVVREQTRADTAPFAVYADWLSERGDPRGTLVALMLELERHGGKLLGMQGAAQRRKDYEHRRAVMAARPGAERNLRRLDVEVQVDDLLLAHGEEWLGKLAGEPAFRCWWWRGFLRMAQLGADPRSSRPVELHVANLYAELLTLPAAAALSDSRFGARGPKETLETSRGAPAREPRIKDPSWQLATDALVEHGVPETVERISYDRGGLWHSAATHSGSLEPLYAAIPFVRHLYFRLGHFDFGEIVLPNLRDFEIATGGLTRDDLSAITEAHWPNLERLVLSFGDLPDESGDCDCELQDLARLIAAPPLRLRELGIANAAFADDVAPVLAGTDLLARLDALDLSRGRLSDTGAERILDCADAYRHLKRLDVSHNFLSEEMIERLRETIPGTDGSHQRDGC